LYLTLENEIQREFGRVVTEYEEYVSTLVKALVSPEDGLVTDELVMLSSIKESGRFTSFRLSVWETQWFDEEGTYHRDAPDESSLQACSCILEFQGAWYANGKTGLKFRCIQIKAEPAHTIEKDSNTSSNTPSFMGFQFLDE